MDMKWADFNLGKCAQEGDDKAKKSGFQEFPIVPGGSAWQGGPVEQGPDRVIFQVVDGSTAAFCGIIRHPGQDGVQNHFQMCTDAPSDTTATPFTPGWCGFHVVQHQKPDPSKDAYRFDIDMKDSLGIPIGGGVGFDGRQPFDVTSKLPWTLVVIPGNVDEDPISFKYSTQSWTSDDEAHCSFGGYEDGNREGDCGFTC